MTPLADMKQAARIAGALLLRRRAGIASLEIEAKGRHDFVTSVDREAEDTLVKFLEERWPGVPFLAEESDARKAGGGERFIIDPLDGTTNYIHGYPCYGVSIAFQSGGALAAGVVFDPAHDELFCAEAGKGACLNDKAVVVSGVDNLEQALLVTGFPFRFPQHLDSYMKQFRLLLEQSSGVRRDGSAALDLCTVAAGRCDGFWEVGLSPWDVAAGGLIVSEAGGLVTDYRSGDGWLEGSEIVAASPGLHPALITAIETAGA